MRYFFSEILFHENQLLCWWGGQQSFAAGATKPVGLLPPTLNDISNAFNVLHVKHFLGLARWEFQKALEVNP
jgi:hypothetical protein